MGWRMDQNRIGRLGDGLKLALVTLALSACGASELDVARAGLTTTAYAAVTADKSFAEAYRLASEAARAASDTQEAKDARMAGWDEAADDVETIVNDVYASLAAAEIALDVWEATNDPSNWYAQLPCLIEKLRELERVLSERGLQVPATLRRALSLADGLSCESP